MRELSNLAKWGYHSKITEISLIFWLWALFLLSVVFEMSFWDMQQPLLQVLIWTPLVQTKQDTLLTLPLPNSNKIPTLRWQLSGPDIALPLATGRGSPGRRRSKVAKRQRRTAVDGVDRWVNISSNALFAQDTRLRHGWWGVLRLFFVLQLII